MDPRSRLRLLDWDSTFFGKRLARIDAGPLTVETLGEILQAGEDARIDSVSFLADPSDAVTLRALERHAFELMDVRLELETPVEPRVVTSVIRPAREDDLGALIDIARTSHRNTRFHTDTRFGTARADELYAVWIERSVRGELADDVFIAEASSRVVGYMTLSGRPDDAAQIGLIAVHDMHRGQGIGTQFIAAAHEWCVDSGRSVLQVVTPGRSTESLRFYERMGFLTRRIGFWYHRWR